MRSHERVIILLFVLYLLLPHLGQGFGLDESIKINENRRLVVFPSIPRKFGELSAYSGKIDNYINDHFPLRSILIVAKNRVYYKLFGEFTSDQVLAGKDGSVFLSSHHKGRKYSLFKRACTRENTRKEAFDTIQNEMRSKVEELSRYGADVGFVIVPSKSVVYPELLPDYVPGLLASKCRSGSFSAPRYLADLLKDKSPELSSKYMYLLDDMLGLKKELKVFHGHMFHWYGISPMKMAMEIMKTRFSIQNFTPPGSALELKDSDLGHFFPGVRISQPIDVPQIDEVYSSICRGGECIDGLDQIYERAGDVTSVKNLNIKSGKSLLLISDSFGKNIAEYFSLGFSQVFHVSTNHLKEDEKGKFLKGVINLTHPTSVLFLYHDGGFLRLGSI